MLTDQHKLKYLLLLRRCQHMLLLRQLRRAVVPPLGPRKGVSAGQFLAEGISSTTSITIDQWYLLNLNPAYRRS